MAGITEFDQKILKIEAEEAVKEVSFAVDFVEISPKLPATDECIYMNLRTKENEIFCVELSVSGFKVGNNYYIIIIVIIGLQSSSTG